MIAERTIRFIIAASIALGIMCFQTWWRFDLGNETLRIRALGLDGVTPWDGTIVLVCAILLGALALLGLVQPNTHRKVAAGIVALSLATFAITTYDIIGRPEAPQFIGFGIIPPPHFHAAPILYFAAVTSFLIAVAGTVLAVAQDEHTKARELSESGALQW